MSEKKAVTQTESKSEKKPAVHLTLKFRVEKVGILPLLPLLAVPSRAFPFRRSRSKPRSRSAFPTMEEWRRSARRMLSMATRLRTIERQALFRASQRQDLFRPQHRSLPAEAMGVVSRIMPL